MTPDQITKARKDAEELIESLSILNRENEGQSDWVKIMLASAQSFPALIDELELVSVCSEQHDKECIDMRYQRDAADQRAMAAEHDRDELRKSVNELNIAWERSETFAQDVVRERDAAIQEILALRKDLDAALERVKALAALAEFTKDEFSMARRLRAGIVEARRRLAKGRALWNGPCHECDGVLEKALMADAPTTADYSAAKDVALREAMEALKTIMLMRVTWTEMPDIARAALGNLEKAVAVKKEKSDG